MRIAGLKSMGGSKRPTVGEMTSLAERMGYLQALRVGFAVVTIASTLFASNIVGASVSDLMLATALYLAVAAGSEVLRRVVRIRALPVVGGMLLVDGLYLAWAMYATGGTQSPLRFLLYSHLIAVTLLASYRTGLKIAMWHSLLFFIVFYAQAAGLLEATDAAAGVTPRSAEFNRVSVFNVLAFWLIAAGTAIFSALNERELRRRKGDLEDLATMAASLEEAAPGEVAQILLDSVGDSFGFKRGVVVGSDESGAPVLAYRGPGDIPSSATGVDAVVSRAWRDKQILLTKQLEEKTDPRLSKLLPFARNLVVAPLFADGRSVGALVLEHPTKLGHRIERRVVDMVGQFAAHGALAIRNASLMQQVQRMADTDALTGLANRRSFEARLDQELSRAARNGEPVTLMMLDVDRFKRFNDSHGHQAGDDVLRHVGATLIAASRDFDTPARYGGEEFAVVLPACSPAESLIVAERIRKLIGEIETVETVTASAGVASYPAHATTATDLVKAADEALYESKRSGRDRLTRSQRRVILSPSATSAD
jgi:diguanylate cyclase (GGDEF)-like protein